MSAEEVLAAHPDLADELHRYLDVLGEMRSPDDTIKALVARGILAESDDPAYQANLGEYRTIGSIGRGGMGIVVKAHEKKLNRTVALKILRPELADDRVALERFTREAKAAAALRHPNIVTVYAVGEEQGVHFLAMEYVEGPTLAEVIREHGPLPTETIRHLFRGLLSGLAAAHEAGLIHRDIKPANLLLDGWIVKPPSPTAPDNPLRAGFCEAGEARAPADGTGPTRPGSDSSFQLKIADFGLARMMNSQTRITVAESILGTAEYMSPEQVRGDDDLDQRMDLYSAGVVLYEMLTGRTPFPGDSPSAVIHRILNEEPAHPRTIATEADPHLASLALRLMAKRPEDRFATATKAQHALQAGEHVQSPERSRRRRRRALLGVLALALVCGSGWMLIRSTARPPIAAVRVETDAKGEKTAIIHAWYGDEPDPRVISWFRGKAPRVTDAWLLDPDGKGPSAVVAGVQGPIDGQSLFVFDALDDEPSWSLDLSSKMPWPDCARPPEWYCEGLATGNVDGKPGDEIIAVGTDWFEYPTRISVVNPRTRTIRSTFWHMGNITRICIAEDFFGSGLPAIVATGRNNKLDGFDEPSPGDEAPHTLWDIVVVAMILDPRNMEGLGPPLTDRPELRDSPPAYLHAYAFLNLPASPDARYDADGKPLTAVPEPSDVTTIGSFEDSRYSDDPDIANGFTLGLTRPLVGGGATLTLDRNLAVRRFVCGSGERVGRKIEYWEEHWHIIIQNGEYLRDRYTNVPAP